MPKCLYCDRGLPPTHFTCEVCGDGMCDACYNEDKEHDEHIQNPADLDWKEDYAKALDIIFKGGYGCDSCVNTAILLLNHLKGAYNG